MRQVREERPTRFHTVNNFERLRDSKVRRVWVVLQRVEDQRVEPFEQRPTLVRDAAHVGAKRDIGAALTKHRQTTVQQPNWLHSLTQHLEGFQPDANEL